MHDKGLKLWIFPEGTRYREEGLLPFKKGAFNIAVNGQIPIVPVVFSNYDPFYSHKKRYFRTPGYVIAQVMKPILTTGVSGIKNSILIEKLDFLFTLLAKT